MDRHIRILGILFIVWGVKSIMFSVFGAAFFAYSGFILCCPTIFTIVNVIVIILAGLAFIVGVADIIAGIGLLKRESWSRILAIIMAIVSLLDVPFGTALGIYALWVLFNPESEKYLSGEKTEQEVTA